MFKYFFLFICFFSFNSYSQTVELFCKGVSSGTDVRTESIEFPLWVRFDPADFGGIRSSVVPGCMANVQSPNAGPSCKSTSNELDCSCKNHLGFTTFNLSRITGRLKTLTLFTDKARWEGDYYCDKITSKKF